MNTVSRIKKAMKGKAIKVTMLATLLLLAGGSVLGTSAQARTWGGPRVFIGARAGFFGYPGYYAYGGYPYYYYSPRYDAGPYEVAAEKGYHDGFNRGREDARDARIYDPNNSSHFRDSISRGYRDGFRRGYHEAYRR